MKRLKTTRQIKGAVIGYSSAFEMGKAHLTQMKQAGMTPTAVCEMDPKRLRAAEADFPGIETYDSVSAMLRRSEANLIAIITPHNTHAKLALQCLRAGRHVVCEKPMAITTAECDRMIAAAARRRVMVSTYHNRHWDGCILQAMAVIRRGAIGELHRVDSFIGGYGNPGDWWRSNKTVSGGILYDWGIHLLEYALQIIDAKIVEVGGFAHNGFWAPRTRWKAETNEDEASAVVRFSSGARLVLTHSQIDADPKSYWLTITGTKGVYSFDHSRWKLVTAAGTGRKIREGRNRQSQWHRYYANVAAHLVRGERLVISGAWSRRPIHILDLAGRSAKQGRTLRAKHE